MAQKQPKEKKKGNRKKTLLIVLGVIIVLGLFGSTSENETEETLSETETLDTQQNEEQEVAADVSVIELIAGEQGEYGELITMSEGTDMEESFYAYYVPGGTYEVTNKGDYMTQVTVYEGFSRNEETGYDDYTNIGDALTLDIGKTDTIEIPDGWFIEIHEPAHITLLLAE